MVTRKQRAEVYKERLAEELSDLSATGVSFSGTIPSPVCILKGKPNAQELAGASVLSGADGDALSKSLDALGYLPNSACALLTVFISDHHTAHPLPPELVRLAIEVLDSSTLLVADKPAALALQEAYKLPTPLEEGVIHSVKGRRVLCLGGFEDSLDNEREKQIMWARLKKLPPEQAPY